MYHIHPTMLPTAIIRNMLDIKMGNLGGGGGGAGAACN